MELNGEHNLPPGLMTDDTPDNQATLLLQRMHDLNDKLLSLDYVKEFVSRYKCPAINRHYFCRQSNQAQQFFTFCCLSSYLINRISGKNDLKVDSFDDPNLTIDKILEAARSYIDVANFGSVKQKFKQGWGAEVVTFLDALTDKCWSAQATNQDNLPIVRISVIDSDGTRLDPDEEERNEDDEVDHDEDNEIELEEEFSDYIVADNEQDGWNEDEDEVEESEEKRMIMANTDLAKWKLEFERILPQLNARLVGQNLTRVGGYESEWRLHLRAALEHHAAIETTLGHTTSMARGLTTELRSALDKIHSKENYLHQNLNTILAEWSNVRERALMLQDGVDRVQAAVSDKSARLQQLNEEDRSTKHSIEEYSLRMTDSSPLVEAKKAREMLKQELVKVNLQIGVAIQTLVRHVTVHASYIY